MLCRMVPSSSLPPFAKYGGCVSVVPNITSPHPTSTCEPNQTELWGHALRRHREARDRMDRCCKARKLLRGS